MNRTTYWWPLLGLLGGCKTALGQSQPEPPVTYFGTNTPRIPGFEFKGNYDSSEIFQKRGVYYTRIGQQIRRTSRADTLLSEPQKMQTMPYIYVRGPVVPPATVGPVLRVSCGRFIDGRKDGQWFYAKFVKQLTPGSGWQRLPSPDSTLVEVYRMGKLLSRKRGAPYHGHP